MSPLGRSVPTEWPLAWPRFFLQGGPASGSAISGIPKLIPRPSAPKLRLCSHWLDSSDLGSPALDELHDLLDLKLGEMKVISQDVFTELHKDTSVDALLGKEAHHIL